MPPKPNATEFLEEMLVEAKKFLPAWLYSSLMKAARARSGGRSSHRVDAPSMMEKLALVEIQPSKLKDIDDEDLQAIWLRLHQWYTSAKRRTGKTVKKAVEGVLDNFAYLLHHVSVSASGKEDLEHCYVYDHLGNMFEQQHLVVKNGRATVNGRQIMDESFHFIVGLEPDQDVAWSDEEAIENKIKPKKMMAGMSYREKAREW